MVTRRRAIRCVSRPPRAPSISHIHGGYCQSDPTYCNYLDGIIGPLVHDVEAGLKRCVLDPAYNEAGRQIGELNRLGNACSNGDNGACNKLKQGYQGGPGVNPDYFPGVPEAVAGIVYRIVDSTRPVPKASTWTRVKGLQVGI